MGRFFLSYLTGASIYKCNVCGSHLSTPECIESKQFQGRGKAYLFNYVVNTLVGEPEDRLFNSGEYTVRDLHCISCMSVIGWRYDISKREDQKYKEGKYIIEKSMMVKVTET
eukprot:TRINITY_DN348_c0_g1_i1.p1 TRINITY_DN348_c0_g1~~TRINITY_DN348_c0_g1_i1.p1  ORF type:complete len:112 (-),score=2.38 TRINITY_DN348_c0_g1_i1:226-561(-)